MKNSVTLGIPHTGSIRTEFLLSYRENQDIISNIIQAHGSLVCKNRELIVDKFLNSNSNYLLFVDTDMDWRGVSVRRMVDKDIDMLAANCSLRKPGLHQTAQKRKGSQHILVNTHAHSYGYIEVDRVGLGFALIKREALETVDKPRFFMNWDERYSQYVGEDYSFCDKLISAGKTICIDHGISKLVRHIGSFSYGVD